MAIFPRIARVSLALLAIHVVATAFPQAGAQPAQAQSSRGVIRRISQKNGHYKPYDYAPGPSVGAGCPTPASPGAPEAPEAEAPLPPSPEPMDAEPAPEAPEAPEEEAPEAPEAPVADEAAAADAASLSADTGLAAAPASAAPNMIGDFLPPPVVFQFSSNVFAGPLPGSAPLQIGQNNSPLPKDRAYFTWDHFHNAYQLQGDHLDVFTVGLERSFNCGVSSWEIRLPATYGPSATQIAEIGRPDADGQDGEFGDMSLIYKRILYHDCCRGLTVSGGLGLQLPTGPDTSVRDEDPTILDPEDQASFSYDNETFMLTPYLALLAQPNDRWFGQMFLQWDIPLGEDGVSYSRTGGGFGAPITASGDVERQSMMHVDLSVGRWLCRNHCARYVQGVALLFESHYTTTLEDAEVFNVPDPLFGAAGVNVGNLFNRMDIWNLTFGVTAQMGCSTVTMAYVEPLTELDNGDGIFNDGLFDGEVQVQWNRAF